MKNSAQLYWNPRWKTLQDLWGSYKIVKDLLKILKDKDLSGILKRCLKDLAKKFARILQNLQRSWKIFEQQTLGRSLKIYADPQRSWQEISRSSKTLTKKLTVLEDSYTAQIQARKLQILEDLGKNFLRSCEDPLNLMNIFEDPWRYSKDFHQGWQDYFYS